MHVARCNYQRETHSTQLPASCWQQLVKSEVMIGYVAYVDCVRAVYTINYGTYLLTYLLWAKFIWVNFHLQLSRILGSPLLCCTSCC